MDLLVGRVTKIKTKNEIVSNSTFVNLSKIDHLVFKVDTYASAISCNTKLDYKDSDNYRLGKWYHNERKQIIFFKTSLQRFECSS